MAAFATQAFTRGDVLRGSRDLARAWRVLGFRFWDIGLRLESCCFLLVSGSL